MSMVSVVGQRSILNGPSSSRFILRRKIGRVPRNAVFIRSSMYDRSLRKVAVRWRSGCLPFQCRSFPGVVGVGFFAMADAPEEINDERNLSQSQADRRP